MDREEGEGEGEEEGVRPLVAHKKKRGVRKWQKNGVRGEGRGEGELLHREGEEGLFVDH